MNPPPPLVTVRCTTFNHAPYIRECLEGFIQQQTSFPVEFLVHDDASTDGTADIVREYAEKYPERITAIIQTENQWSKKDGSIRRILNAHTRGKYTAVCEGDDYWIDPLKLQKQVDFLEANPDYGMCHTRMRRYYQETGLEEDSQTLIGLEETAETLLQNYFIYTLTIVYSTELYGQYIKDIEPSTKGWLMGDTPRFLWMLINSKVKGLEDITGVYRILKESASHSEDTVKTVRFALSGIKMRLYFLRRYQLNISKYAVAKQWYRNIMATCIIKRNKTAFKLTIRSLLTDNRDLLLHPIFTLRMINSCRKFITRVIRYGSED